jgi:diaminohydroxyphosphoribosylaminopyrimidine deaminase/5-amino-6-(5-phosphoribosylamino)uracil reductase
VRIAVDTRLRTPPGSRLVRSARETPFWIVTGADAPAERVRALEEHGVVLLRVAAGRDRVDLAAALRAIGERGITRLLVEGGPILAAALLRAELVDEAALFRSRAAIGPEGIDALEGMPLTALTASARLAARGRDTLGDDSVEFFARV